jgi:hypothetical protein
MTHGLLDVNVTITEGGRRVEQLVSLELFANPILRTLEYWVTPIARGGISVIVSKTDWN